MRHGLRADTMEDPKGWGREGGGRRDWNGEYT